MTQKVFVPFDFALAESFFSGEIRSLPSATTFLVAVGAGIEPAGGSSTSSWRRGEGAIVSPSHPHNAGREGLPRNHLHVPEGDSGR